MSTEKKLICQIGGGLGNQLFTYAAAYSIAKRNNAKLFIDRSYGFYFDKEYSRNYLLDRFNLDCESFSLNKYLINYERIKRKINLYLNKKREFFKRNLIFQESLDFDKRLNSFQWKKGSIYLTGYWQSYKYFVDYEQDIKSQFKLKSINSIESNSEFIKNINSNFCCVHIRFFDNDLDDFKSSYMYSYYKKAVLYFIEKLKNPNFVIFSNDKNKANKIFSSFKINRYIFNSFKFDSDETISDFYLMKKFSNYIISNSSFSWWAAWLSEAKNKKVVCPGLISYENIGAWGFKGHLPKDWERL